MIVGIWQRQCPGCIQDVLSAANPTFSVPCTVQGVVGRSNRWGRDHVGEGTRYLCVPPFSTFLAELVRGFSYPGVSIHIRLLPNHADPPNLSSKWPQVARTISSRRLLLSSSSKSSALPLCVRLSVPAATFLTCCAAAPVDNSANRKYSFCAVSAPTHSWRGGPARSSSAPATMTSGTPSPRLSPLRSLCPPRALESDSDTLKWMSSANMRVW